MSVMNLTEKSSHEPLQRARTSVMKVLTSVILSTLLAVDLFAATTDQPVPRCGYTVVSYRFIGAPGTAIVYAGRTFTISRSGMIELIAVKQQLVYRIHSRAVTLGGTPDEFGTVTVQLPNPNGR